MDPCKYPFMKFTLSPILPLIFILLTSCSSGSTQQSFSEYSGIIESAGMTTYQYGTHTLKTNQSFFALKSDAVNLEEFEGKKVSIRANKIEGYPVDGGPEFLEVLQVSEK